MPCRVVVDATGGARAIAALGALAADIPLCLAACGERGG